MLDREEQIKLAFVFYVYASCLFLYGSDVILISLDTFNLSASCFLAGSVLFVIANSIQICYATGFNKFLIAAIILADVMFVVGAIMFYPAVNHAIVGNWLYLIASWIVIFVEIVKLYHIYKSPPVTWLLETIFRTALLFGAILFVVGNCLLINDPVYYLYQAFKCFTSGCVLFVVGSSAQLYIKSSMFKKE